MKMIYTEVSVPFEVVSDEEGFVEEHAQAAAALIVRECLVLVAIQGHSSIQEDITVGLDGFGKCQVRIEEPY